MAILSGEMSIADAIILGLVQGLTEFIPISSSGHLILIDKLTGVQSSFAFDVLVNIGTLLALLVYFRNNLAELARNVLRHKDYRLLSLIAASTIPAIVIGGIWSDVFAGDSVRNLTTVGIMLGVVGILMLVADHFWQGQLKIAKLTLSKAWLIGLAQAAALIPGTSRSGATILMGRAVGLSNAQAAEYSFLIAMPIIGGAVLRSLFETETQTLLNGDRAILIAGIASAFVSGFFAIAFLLRFLKTRGLKVFGLYRIILALWLLLGLT